MKTALVVGCSGGIGAAITEALKRAGYHVVGTRKGANDLRPDQPHPDRLVKDVDVIKRDWLVRLLPGLGQQRYDVAFLAMAYAGCVGVPYDEHVSPAAKREATRYSFTPLLQLEQVANVVVGCGMFPQIKVAEELYGAMLWAKRKFRPWIIQGMKSGPPFKRYMLRSTLVETRATKGIVAKLARELTRRKKAQEREDREDILVKNFGAAQGLSDLFDLVRQRVLDEEREAIGNTHITCHADLCEATRTLLQFPNQPIVNVAADHIWLSAT